MKYLYRLILLFALFLTSPFNSMAMDPQHSAASEGKQEADDSQESFNFLGLPEPIQHHILDLACSGDRGEIHYLLGSLPSKIKAGFEYNSHRNTIWTLAYNKDSSVLATGSRDNKIILWDIKTPLFDSRIILQNDLNVFSGHTGLIHAIAHRPHSHEMASGSRDGTIRIWNIFNSQSIHTLRDDIDQDDHATIQAALPRDNECNQKPDSWVLALLYSPDGSQLISGHGDGVIRIWNTDKGTLICSIMAHSDAVQSLAHRPNHNEYASASSDGTVCIWNANTHELIHTLKRHSQAINSICYNHDGTELACGNTNETITIWDAAEYTLKRTIAENGPILSLAYSPNSLQLASGNELGKLNLWDPQTGNLLRTTPARPEHPVLSLTYNTATSQVTYGHGSRPVIRTILGFDEIQRWISSGSPSTKTDFTFIHKAITKPVNHIRLRLLLAGLINMKKKKQAIVPSVEDHAYFNCLPGFVKKIFSELILPLPPQEKVGIPLGCGAGAGNDQKEKEALDCQLQGLQQRMTNLIAVEPFATTEAEQTALCCEKSEVAHLIDIVQNMLTQTSKTE